MAITTALIDSKREWEDFLASHPEANFLQSWNWGAFNQALGKKVHYLGFYQQRQLIGAALLVTEKARRAKYLTLAGGPILEWFDENLVAACYQALKQLAEDERAVFVRIRPQLLAGEFAEKIFLKQWQLTKAPMHLSAELTHRLDLTLSEEELLAKMRKSTRYDLRKADKLGLRLTTSTRVADIKHFHQLQLATAKRQKFVPFSLSFWQEQFRLFATDNQALLYSSYFADELLAQAMIIFYGQEAVYHYGASTDLARKYPGAVAIQWAAIKEARRRGMGRYNFWGVAPVDQPQHRFAKLSTFKRGFGGQDYQYFPAHDLIIDSLGYKINLLVEISRKKLRRV